MALILLAEDESSTIDHVRSVLASQGWLVKTVKSRAQALRAASEFAPQLVLMSDELQGVDDLVRTFSRRSGGPGVVLLTSKAEMPEAGEDIEAILTKPVQTDELIEIIKNKLSAATDKKATTDAGTDVRILSSEEIFGDLLDGILDKDEPEAAAAPEPEEEPAAEETATVDEADDLADFSDLEELAKQTVPALVDAVEAQARKAGELDEDLDVAELLRQTAPQTASPEAESPPAAEDLDEDLEARLSDTLAGVLAASLGAATESAAASSSSDGSNDAVESLLSQALGDLDIRETKVRDKPTSTLAAAAKAPSPEEDEEEEPGVEEDQHAEEGVESVSDEEPEPEVGPAPEPVIEFGEYTLEERIGIGGMAEVWKARRQGVEGFEKRVAIKKILPQPAENQDFVDMFIDEAKLAAQLNHKNITHIYDLGKVDDDYFIAMEYVEGQNLRLLLDAGTKRDKPLPAGLALYVASRTADALDYAHRSKDFNNTELGLVHRDVSPHNVLISYEGDIKLCDFGIAKAVSKIGTTQMGALKGKIQYMSPEQAWGRSIDHRSDIFSTGTLLFEMLTGERLFTGESELAVLEAVRECETAERVIQEPAIPSRVKGLLLKALAKDSEDRFETAGDLLEGLEELLAEFDPTPGQREISSYVRELLDLPEDSARESEPEVPAPDSSTRVPLVEDVTDASAEPAAILMEEAPADVEGETIADEEEKRRPAFLKWLSRLLPVVAVIAVGGYLLAGRTTQSPDFQPSSRPSVVETQAFRPEAVEASLPADSGTADGTATTGTTAQAAPPAEAQAQSTTPPPAVTLQTEEPAAEVEEEAPPADNPVGTGDPAQLEVGGSEAPQETQVGGTTDPELDRRVEEDLLRVQELISTPDFAADNGQDEDAAAESVGGLAEAASTDQDVASDEVGALSQEFEPAADSQDEITGVLGQSDSAVLEESASLEAEIEDSQDSAPLTAEGGEPPEASVPEPGPDDAASSPDLPIAPPAEVPTETQPGDLVEQGPGVEEPQVLSFQPPAYSEIARRVGASGTIRVAVLVDENGQVLETRLVEGLRQNVGLDESTLEAARRATFRPATKDGVPMKMWHELAVRFQP